MVAYTPPDQALNPEKKGQTGDGIDIEIHSTEKAALTGHDHHDDQGCDEESAENVYNETTVPVVRQRRQAKQKRRLWLQLLLIAGMFLGLTLCVVGSIHLYKGMKGADYKGRCGVGIVDMSTDIYVDKDFEGDVLPQTATTVAWERDVVKCGVIEDVEIAGAVETFTVPAQNKSEAATFRLDFDKKTTAIRDDLLNLCFLAPFVADFDTASVPQPAEFSTILNNRESEDSMPVVSEMDEFFSVGPAIDDVMAEFGGVLSDLCSGSTSYKILPASRPLSKDVLSAYDLSKARMKEATTPALATPAAAPMVDGKLVDYWYKMYPGGDALFNYHLLMTEFHYSYDSDL